MPNGFFNSQVRTSLGGGGKDTAQPGGGSMAFKEKPGFSTGAPGKTQSNDRSGGVMKIKAYPSSDGI